MSAPPRAGELPGEPGAAEGVAGGAAPGAALEPPREGEAPPVEGVGAPASGAVALHARPGFRPPGAVAAASAGAGPIVYAPDTGPYPTPAPPRRAARPAAPRLLHAPAATDEA
jgi:hypothetical protein